MNGRIVEKFVTPGRYQKHGRPYENTMLVVEIMWDRELKGKLARMNVSRNTPTGWLAVAKVGTVLSGLELIETKKLAGYDKGRGLIMNPYSKVTVKED